MVADRVVHRAQPPITAADLARVEELIGAPVPDQLAELWRFTAGGELDHELWVPRDGNVECVSWTGLFYVGAEGYYDLIDWLDDQRELTTEEVAELGIDWDGAMPAVPFGGFEYPDRLFVDRGSGEEIV
ncbi:hypothetical protein CGZ93_07285 [Enemella dayhoffiae]|uniref:SMI1/KNR4 family protein n=1 Tax=Enemella dayhoffiae TaxID=2016507 RepID=A0A255H567_9ACTN|nr:SMI1/KNR4 family protein [Enemella dayhoffiae]OYO22835.1 hypothetical protein CGZ93_07285 [Enemella dayhoffiae]